jgi:DNA-binding transcriptional MocR family regulator
MVWQPRIRHGAGTKFMGIVEAIEEDVSAGLVAPGERMPSQRGVAEALGVDLTTVTRAYHEAQLRGILEARPGRGGTWVGAAAPQAATRALIQSVDLSLNIPPQPAQADLANRVSRAIADALKGGAGLLQYGFPMGSESDRIAGATWLKPVVGSVSEGRVLVASGAQAGLFATFAALLQPGDRIALPAVTFPGALAAALRVGAVVVPLAMDEDGILPDALASACRTHGRSLKLLYVVPTLDNPTTATLPTERRLALVEIAQREGLMIVEDDPYRRLVEDAPPAIAALAPQATYHIATLSKCATPGLRIAYVVAPSGHAMQSVADVLRATTLMAPPLMAAAATRWIADGSLMRITRAVREESLARLDLAAKLLVGAQYRSQPGGHPVWLTVPRGRSADAFAADAARCGVAVVPSSAFTTGGDMPSAVRVSLGAAMDRTILRTGLKRLADLMQAAAHGPALV